MQEKITIRIPSELAGAFEQFVKTCPDPIKSKQDGMRFILRDWLAWRGYLEMPPRRKDMH